MPGGVEGNERPAPPAPPGAALCAGRVRCYRMAVSRGKGGAGGEGAATRNRAGRGENDNTHDVRSRTEPTGIGAIKRGDIARSKPHPPQRGGVARAEPHRPSPGMGRAEAGTGHKGTPELDRQRPTRAGGWPG